MRSLRIGIDAHILGKQKGGVETCLFAMVRTLARRDSAHEYFIYVTGKSSLKASGLPPNFHLRRLSMENPWIGRLVLLPYWYRRDRLDLIHVQRAIAPWGCGTTVLHLHDAIHATFPSLFPKWKALIFTRLFRWSGRRAAHVITPSECARADLVRCYAIDPAKISVVPNGVDVSAFMGPVPESDGVVARRFGIRGSYLIHIGAIARNKNIELLVDAFRTFHRQHPAFKLVITGKPTSETRGGYLQELQERVAASNLSGKVVFTGYLPDGDLRSLLSGARMLVFPSLAEGFGFPPLEAMAAGVPSITADTPISHEIYGDAVLRVAPNDASDLAAKMTSLARDSQLAARCVERGRSRLQNYRWEDSCSRLIEVYEQVCGRKLMDEASVAIPQV
ncbi:MAG: glycosyltransferase family 4 protein [Acidobacteriota bacterium]|nr:glycosyltransferase family 4 protein [Acidobacteriota bacterium]